MPVIVLDGIQFDESNWVYGRLNVDDERFEFEAKIFDLPSEFGIPTKKHPSGGCISKLLVRDINGKEIIGYDRGWNGNDIADTEHPEYGPYSSKIERDIIDFFIGKFD